jgi:hypothetical protein
MYTYPARHDRTCAVPAQSGFSGEPTKGKIASRPIHMEIGLIGKAAGDQQTHRLTNQSPVVLGKRMLCEDKVRGASPSRLAITDAASTNIFCKVVARRIILWYCANSCRRKRLVLSRLLMPLPLFGGSYRGQ